MKAITISCFIFAISSCTAQKIDGPFYLQSVGYSRLCYCLTFDKTSEFGLMLETCGAGSKKMVQFLYDQQNGKSQIIFFESETYQYMDVSDGIGEGGKYDGRPILHFKYRGGDNQSWIVANHDGRGFTFKNLMTHGYLSVNAEDRTNVSQTKQVTGDYQIWRASREPNCLPQ